MMKGMKAPLEGVRRRKRARESREVG